MLGGSTSVFVHMPDILQCICLGLDLICLTSAVMPSCRSWLLAAQELLTKPWWLFLAGRHLLLHPCRCSHMCARQLFLFRTFCFRENSFAFSHALPLLGHPPDGGLHEVLRLGGDRWETDIVLKHKNKNLLS